jgi:transposase-like protein
VYKVIDINDKKSDVLSHAKCPRCNSSDKEATEYVGDNYNLRCKHCWYEWTESWRPSMAKEDKTSPK